MSTRVWRVLLVVAALAAGGYGALLLWGALGAAPASVLRWLVAGVLVHDALLAPLVLLVGVLARRLLPVPWQAPAAVALVVWGGLTLLAIPVLGRFGALPDDPTLLDRPYLTSWLWLSALVVALTALAGWWRRARQKS